MTYLRNKTYLIYTQTASH